MNFEEFQQCARLYVLGALEISEMKQFEQATKKFGQKAKDFVRECYALHEALALSIRPPESAALFTERLISMVRQRG